jgi:hypothetical protein
MSTKNLIFIAIGVFTVGIMVALVTGGFLNKPSADTGPTFEQGLQKATEESFNGQNPADVAKGVIQKVVKENDQIISIEPAQDGEYETYSGLNKPIDEKLLEKFKVDTLLDGTIVYSLSREDIKSTGLSSVYLIEIDPGRCLNNCTFVKTRKEYIKVSPLMYYLSSFSYNDKIYWIGFNKDVQGYTWAQISEPSFINSNADYFINKNIKKINQKEANSSIYIFDLEDGKSVTVDFKQSSLINESPDATEKIEIQRILEEGDD